MFCVALEGKARSHERKSKRANACGPTIRNGGYVCMCVCSHSDLGTNMPATLEKELDMRRGITWMYFKVFSPKGPGRGSTHCGCT